MSRVWCESGSPSSEVGQFPPLEFKQSFRAIASPCLSSVRVAGRTPKSERKHDGQRALAAMCGVDWLRSRTSDIWGCVQILGLYSEFKNGVLGAQPWVIARGLVLAHSEAGLLVHLLSRNTLPECAFVHVCALHAMIWRSAPAHILETQAP